MIGIELTARQIPEENLRKLLAQLDDLSGIHEAIAGEAEELTRDYLREISTYRHKTAQGLGAEPTGALAKAAERVGSSSTKDAATVHVIGNLFARAFADVVISATNAKALTIPIAAEAYGKRVGELEAQGWRFFRPKKGSRLLWATNPEGQSKPMYVLATRIEQQQDRTLLPSDEEYLDAARQGATNYLDRLLTEI